MCIRLHVDEDSGKSLDIMTSLNSHVKKNFKEQLLLIIKE